MADGINVRITGKLRLFVESQIGESGVYESVSEYIRSLVRQDFERVEAEKWNALHGELAPGMRSPEDKFVEFSPKEIKTAARRVKNRYAT